MKKKTWADRLRSFRFPVFFSFFVLVVSCDPGDGRLGIDLLPPGDTIMVFTDTITDFEVHLVRSLPVFSSIYTPSPSKDRLSLLGTITDTASGVSKADLVTQLAFTSIKNMGTAPMLDSLRLWLYVSAVEGDTSQSMRILVHEFTGEISYEQAYFSNYDIADQYDPVPLVDEVIKPKAGSYYSFDITNDNFLERISQLIADSAFSSVDSMHLVQAVLPGLYITTEAEPDSRLMAKIQLANDVSRLGFQYVHDSIPADSVTAASWDWFYLNFSEFYAQNISMFSHDFTGTALEHLIDNPAANSPVLYVQGMTGVNVEISIPGFDTYLDSTMISINSARLVFEVLTDSILGIPEEEYPQNLLLSNAVNDSTRQAVYDYLINSSTTFFGKLSRSNEVSAFMDPLYQYKFNIGLHLQSVLTGELENTNLILFVKDPLTTTKFIKLWSNDSGQKGSLRLELVYTKF